MTAEEADPLSENPWVSAEMISDVQDIIKSKYSCTPNIWLVGSRVTGDASERSDLDVVIDVHPMHFDPETLLPGRYIRRECGVDIHIIEDPDGPIGDEFICL